MPQAVLRGVAWATLAPIVWLFSASAIFLYLGGLWSSPAIPAWQRPIIWALYEPLIGRDFFEMVYWIVSGIALPALAIGVVIRRKGMFAGPALLKRDPSAARIVRGVTDNHGHADWMPIEKAQELFPGPSEEYGGVVVGEAYRVDQDSVAHLRFTPSDRSTWGQGGSAPLLIDPCTEGQTHSLLFAGSGGFKTTSAISTLLHWFGSAVVLDPSCEIGPMLACAREMMGHTVRQLTLDDPECGFNVLDWIDTESPHAATHIRSVVWWVAGGEQAGGKQSDASQFFKTRGHSLIACLLSHLLWSDELPPEERNLANLRKMIATPEPEMRDALRYIHVHSKSSVARDYAGTLMGLVDETFSGVYANADEDTAWLANPAFANLVSGSSFRTTDITQGRLTVFIQIPLMALMHSPSVARVILGALLNAAYAADGNIKGRVLYLIDEAARLGTMQMLEEARDAGRKYGITLQLLYQEEAQLLKQWGREGKRAWFGGVSWRGYAAVQDPETAKELCSVFGSYAVLATSEGSNKGTSGRGIIPMSRSTGGNRNVHEIRRDLIRPDELLADVRTDEMFVIPRNARPIRCGRAIYFRRPEMVDLVDVNRFHKAGDAA